MIAFCEAIHLAAPVLTQSARDIVRDSDVQRGAMLVGENVHPMAVVAHWVELIRDVSLRST